jgi:hypothetical protein
VTNYAPIPYARLTVRLTTDDDRQVRRTAWVRVGDKAGRHRKFWVVSKDGEEPDPRELWIVAPADIVRERPARMNLTYAELELV